MSIFPHIFVILLSFTEIAEHAKIKFHSLYAQQHVAGRLPGFHTGILAGREKCLIEGGWGPPPENVLRNGYLRCKFGFFVCINFILLCSIFKEKNHTL